MMIVVMAIVVDRMRVVYTYESCGGECLKKKVYVGDGEQRVLLLPLICITFVVDFRAALLIIC